MHYFTKATEQNEFPAAADPDRARLGLELWREAARKTGDSELAFFAEEVAENAQGRRILEAIFGNSPFLTQCATSDLPFSRTLLMEGPEKAYAAVMDEIEGLRRQPIAETDLMRILRHQKRRVSLTVALADISGAWAVPQVTHALSDFADRVLGCAARHLLRESAAAGSFSLSDPEDPELGSGLIILALGKLGGRELNYSSDIDLIVFYDDERIKTDKPDTIQNSFVRLTRGLVSILEQRTKDGYVFRTDLRLRPDPGSTPPAISAIAAETYYESLGQNWERAAMIKARPVAGDIEAGYEFLHRLRPFIWRKNLDFAAIQDIHSIKRQINANRGGASIAVLGHNLKLGRGGIREIEFFAQTQQLIWGGRIPELRAGTTESALRALADQGQVAEETANSLIESYRYLRRAEHRLQMINDEQTHTLPPTEDKLREFSVFLGYANTDLFSQELMSVLKNVESHYAHLFEDAPALTSAGGSAGNLVFTGGDVDPETIETLTKLGFKNPETVDGVVRGWHHGRVRAVRSARARELLTELMPVLLEELSRTADPDNALLNFNDFLAGLPAGVQLFSMFHSNPHLLELVAQIMGVAPRLAERLSRRPMLLESVLTQDFMDPPPDRDALRDELEKMLEQADNIEDVLDLSRRWANDRKFQIGVQRLRGTLPANEGMRALSNIADVAILCLYPRMESEFARHHGRIPHSGMAVVALGKLGGQEMTPSSDLDLIFIYTLTHDADLSEGKKPLPASQYFARLSQRLINSLTAITAEGQLYQVDMRLRPSGSAGPIASSLDAFVQYNRSDAWTWEHMALTRARIITGPPALSEKIEGVIRDILSQPRDPDMLTHDVAHMRERIDKERHTDLIWNIKYLRGGLVDIEFIAQYLQLKHAHHHPEILSANTKTALQQIGEANLIDASVCRDLMEAIDLWQPLQAILRLTLARDFNEEREQNIPEALQSLLSEIGGVSNYDELKDKISKTAAKVHGHFQDLIGEPGDHSNNLQT
ncbi:MAG: bifunctional [glutamine synthetase] adenylyltransferase/[glutamine synthetase]-adenylyl-L-tyrosine phosphorylase [Rhodospirillales bacterium]|nr:bifunctional [glutamine synthetase] adenylyltransferase/[glutamine synthetase]-adenylyl-L-tyrosine phosphorylase [Rhodospirillales bacterium]